MTKQKFLSGLVGFFGTVSMGIAAESSLNPASAGCFPKGSNGKVSVRLVDAAALSSARVYFHAQGQTGDYYLDMRKSVSGETWAILPRTAAGTQGVVYRVRTVDAKGHEISMPETRVNVAAACAASPLSTDEASYAANLVVGQTMDEQAAVPPGFLCDGIVSLISSKGEMRAGLACRDAEAVRLGAGSTLKSPATGISGGVVIRDTGGTAKPLSPSRPSGPSDQ
jgi:hypothetical protein